VRAQGGVVVALVTAANEAQAVSIARTLVKEQLAACVNIVGQARSVYRWRGEIQEDREHLMVIKTRRPLLARLEHRVKELHSYEVPEVIALSVAAGSRAYLDWIAESTASKPARRKAGR